MLPVEAMLKRVVPVGPIPQDVAARLTAQSWARADRYLQPQIRAIVQKRPREAVKPVRAAIYNVEKQTMLQLAAQGASLDDIASQWPDVKRDTIRKIIARGLPASAVSAEGSCATPGRYPWLERKLIDMIDSRNAAGDVLLSKGAVLRWVQSKLPEWCAEQPDDAPRPPHDLVTHRWFNGVLMRHGYEKTRLHGERRSADMVAAFSFCTQLALDVDPRCHVNADESLFFFARVGREGIDRKAAADQNRGLKDVKKRTGVLFTVQSTGEVTFPLLQCHTAAVPQSFPRDVPIAEVGGEDWVYVQGGKAYIQPQHHFRNLKELVAPRMAEYCVRKGLPLRCVYWLDNCSSHNSIAMQLGIEYGEPRRTQAYLDFVANGHVAWFDTPSGRMAVVIRWLPKNTTSVLQPCDQGIIAATKRRARTLMETWLLESPLGGMEASLNAITVYQAMTWLGTAWRAVRARRETTEHAWKHLLWLPLLVATPAAAMGYTSCVLAFAARARERFPECRSYVLQDAKTLLASASTPITELTAEEMARAALVVEEALEAAREKMQ